MKKIRVFITVVLYTLSIMYISLTDNHEMHEIAKAITTDTTFAETTNTASASRDKPTDTFVTTTSENVPVFFEYGNGRYAFPKEFYSDLSDIMEKYPHFNNYDISVAYSDIETGFSVMINPDNHYYSASLIKAPYILHIYELALENKANTSDIVVFEEQFRRNGTGVIKDMEPGKEFTIEELIGLSIKRSDNTAFAMLKNVFPENEFVGYMNSIGVDYYCNSGNMICAESAIDISREIYNFIEEGNPYSQNLYEYMTSTLHPMIYAGENSEIARKYGWYAGYFHDMAIIYDERPYTLAILTNFEDLEIGETEYQLFKDISALFYNYSGKLSPSDGNDDVIIIRTPKDEEKKDNH